MVIRKPEILSRSRRTAGGITVEILDLREWVEGTENASGYEKKWTAVLVTDQSPLPPFRLGPSVAWVRSLIGWLTGACGLEFVGHPAGERFNRMYSLWPAEVTNQVDVRDLFTRQVLEFFVDEPGWNITSEDGKVMMWREDRILSDDERPALAERAVQVYRVLFRSFKEGGEVLEARAARGPQFSSVVARVAVPFLCGAAGLGLGSALSFLLILVLPVGWNGAKVAAFLLFSSAGWGLGTLAGLRLLTRRSGKERACLPAPSTKTSHDTGAPNSAPGELG